MLSFAAFQRRLTEEIHVTASMTGAFPSWVEDWANPKVDTMSGTQMRLLQFYTKDGFADVNPVLRGQAPSGINRPRQVSATGYSRMMGGASQVITQIFRRFPLPRPVTVYRGINYISQFGLRGDAHPDADVQHLQTLTRSLMQAAPSTATWAQDFYERRMAEVHALRERVFAKYLYGKTVTYSGYLSTTFSLPVATKFAEDILDRDRFAFSAVLELSVPDGTTAIPMIDELGSTEAELLLPDKTRVRIDGLSNLIHCDEFAYYRIPLLAATVV